MRYDFDQVNGDEGGLRSQFQLWNPSPEQIHDATALRGVYDAFQAYRQAHAELLNAVSHAETDAGLPWWLVRSYIAFKPPNGDWIVADLPPGLDHPEPVSGPPATPAS
jgi:hypothetical protein